MPICAHCHYLIAPVQDRAEFGAYPRVPFHASCIDEIGTDAASALAWRLFRVAPIAANTAADASVGTLDGTAAGYARFDFACAMLAAGRARQYQTVSGRLAAQEYAAGAASDFASFFR